MPEAPIYGEINQGSPKRGPTSIYDLMVAGEDRLRRMMGPHAYEAVGKLASLANVFGPQADVADYQSNATSALENIGRGDYGQGAIDAGYAALSGMGLSELAKAGAAMGAGIRAFHGSPHDFDKFDMDKAGTTTDPGALGRGLYFSDDPSVASRDHNYEVDLAIETPLVLEMPDFKTRKVDLVSERLGLTPPQESADFPEWAESAALAAKSRGHDSVVLDYSPTGYDAREIAVFDDSLISIVRKYGVAALVGAGVISATMADQLREQGYTDEPGA